MGQAIGNKAQEKRLSRLGEGVRCMRCGNSHTSHSHALRILQARPPHIKSYCRTGQRNYGDSFNIMSCASSTKPRLFPSILHFQFVLGRLAETHDALFTLVLQPGEEGFGASMKVFNVLVEGSVRFLVACGSLGLGGPSYLAIQLELARRNLLSHPKCELG